MYISVYKLINHNISHSWSHSLFLGVSLVETPLLLPLSCQKKNIRRNFIYNIFLLTFSLTSQGCRSFKLNLEEVSIAGGFLLEKNFPGEGCSVGFRLQFHCFLGVSPRFWLVEAALFCQKKNISRKFIYNMFLLTFSHLRWMHSFCRIPSPIAQFLLSQSQDSDLGASRWPAKRQIISHQIVNNWNWIEEKHSLSPAPRSFFLDGTVSCWSRLQFHCFLGVSPRFWLVEAQDSSQLSGMTCKKTIQLKIPSKSREKRPTLELNRTKIYLDTSFVWVLPSKPRV